MDNFLQVALNVTANLHSNYDKCQSLVDWIHGHFSWPASDYVKRTVEEIFERRSGNCREQAWVLRRLLEEINVPTRWIREINIHPESMNREISSQQLIEEVGVGASVFGLRHNDHMWIEVFIEENNEWVPADPAMGLFGTEQWIETRLHIHKKPHNTLATLDMIVPIAIIAMDDEYHMIDNRSEHYLVDSFSKHFTHVTEDITIWKQWIKSIHEFLPFAQLTFAGSYNLHEQNENIKRLGALYNSFWQKS